MPWFVVALAVLLTSPLEAAKFRHARLGQIEIYTSDSPADTKRLLAELLEIRRQVQELVAPVPLPDSRLQILVFSRQEDYEQFQPVKKILQTDGTTVSGFSYSNYGAVASFVREANDADFARASIRYFYAGYLLLNAVPGEPLWVQAGLPEFFATTEYRGGKFHVGADFMNHSDNIRWSKLLPLAQLTDDDAMRSMFGAARHDNVLYHESWALWHQWMTSPDPKRREQIKRLFAAIRNGAKGDLATITQAFGESAEALDAARRPPVASRWFKPVAAPSPVAAVVEALEFSPAIELDEKCAQAMVAAGTGKGPGALGYNLLRLEQAEPQSPRVAEARAVLAEGEKEMDRAAEHWATARERGSDNPYAYLQPAKVALEGRSLNLNLRSQFPEALCADWRAQLDRCVQLDPGCADAHYLRLMVEAFAPEPQAAAVDLAERSHTLEVRQIGFLYLAIARWRLGQYEEAHRTLERLKQYGRLTDSGRASFSALEQLMEKGEAAQKR